MREKLINYLEPYFGFHVHVIVNEILKIVTDTSEVIEREAGLMDVIVKLVSNKMMVSVDAINSKSQAREECYARYICYYLMRDRGYTITSLAKYFKRSHGPISNQIRDFRPLLKQDRELRDTYEQLKKEVEAYENMQRTGM